MKKVVLSKEVELESTLTAMEDERLAGKRDQLPSTVVDPVVIGRAIENCRRQLNQSCRDIVDKHLEQLQRSLLSTADTSVTFKPTSFFKHMYSSNK